MGPAVASRYARMELRHPPSPAIHAFESLHLSCGLTKRACQLTDLETSSGDLRAKEVGAKHI